MNEGTVMQVAQRKEEELEEGVGRNIIYIDRYLYIYIYKGLPH